MCFFLAGDRRGAGSELFARAAGDLLAREARPPAAGPRRLADSKGPGAGLRPRLSGPARECRLPLTGKCRLPPSRFSAPPPQVAIFQRPLFRATRLQRCVREMLPSTRNRS